MMFAEIKKKYKGIVYKRRVDLKTCDFEKLFTGEEIPGCDHQIRQEIIQFFGTYPNLKPKVYIGYDRIALAGVGTEESLRVTFDRNISYRETDLFLWSDEPVYPVFPDNPVVMEVKTDRAVPLWLVSLLSEYKLYKTSISKYGAYFKSRKINSFSACRKSCLP
jgi:hypothetical protein